MIEVVETEDDTLSLYRRDLDECYHSRFGALEETNRIFIDYGLKFWLQQSGKPRARVLEIGFGTGLNALATLASVKAEILYETLELYPISPALAKRLNYGQRFGIEREFELMHTCPAETKCRINERFSLVKHHTRAETFDYGQESFDIVYMDAFSPEKEPLLWSEDFFKRLFAACSSQGVLTTYCCKGAVRRALLSAGFLVEKLPGPKGKREVLRATKVQSLCTQLGSCGM